MMSNEASPIAVGDLVISMLAPGHFRVIERKGEHLTLENASGIRRTVRETNVRKVIPPPVATAEG